MDSGDIERLFQYTDGWPHVKTARWRESALVNGGRPLIAIVSTPKSGSTWAANVIRRASALPGRRFCYAYSSNEHDLYEPALLNAKRHGGVSQLHMRATPHNVVLLKQFRVKTLLLTRNVFDSVASFARDLQLKLSAPAANPGQHGYSFVWLTPDMQTWTQSELVDYAIDFYVPWYLNFLRSWHCYKPHAEVLPVRYEILRKQPESVFREALTSFALPERQPVAELVARSFGDSNLMSQSGSTDGLLKSTLSVAQINKIEGFFARESSPWVRAHMHIEISGN